MDLRDTIYDELTKLGNQSSYGVVRGFVGAGDVQRIEFVIDGFPGNVDSADKKLQHNWLTGALAAVAMVAPYEAQDAAEAILEARS